MKIDKIKQGLQEQIQQAVKKIFSQEVNPEEIKLSLPPNPQLGDFCLATFKLAKQLKEKPVTVANKIVSSLKENLKEKFIKEVEAIDGYVNFTLDKRVLFESVLENSRISPIAPKKKTIMLEFAHPNTHKEFHIGHLRNIVTGESLARILEDNNYQVVRANYQGDIGLHIAKCLWALQSKISNLKSKNLKEKIKLLGSAYTEGNKAYEEDKSVKKEIDEVNKKIYQQDEEIKEVYQQTRQWSLDYFNQIYQRLGVQFDRLYFESEVWQRGEEIVLKNLKQGIFKKSRGAIIFPGEKFDLHSRVFVNSKGQVTYEGKDMALAELQIKEYQPDKIIHLTGPEQSDYFAVIFKALEKILPQSKGKEMHLPYGWVQLKKGKMSSRQGKIVSAQWLINEIKKEVLKITQGKDKKDKAEKIALAAVKYSLLKTSRTKDLSFDIKESINLSGDSGPYLQYTYARIKSILRKSGQEVSDQPALPEKLHPLEKNLIFQLVYFAEIIKQASQEFEPSLIAKYLFNLGQIFNDYYHQVPVLKSPGQTRIFRLTLIKQISLILKHGLNLLGIEVLEEM